MTCGARETMKVAGLTEKINQFHTREQAEAAMSKYRGALPSDAYVSQFINI